MSIFSLKLSGGELKRFIVGARKGQTLRVSSDAKPATVISYRLVRGEGTEKEIANGISVKLNENGDYVFEIFNNTERDLNFSVTVEIN